MIGRRPASSLGPSTSIPAVTSQVVSGGIFCQTAPQSPVLLIARAASATVISCGSHRPNCHRRGKSTTIPRTRTAPRRM